MFEPVRVHAHPRWIKAMSPCTRSCVLTGKSSIERMTEREAARLAAD